MPIVYSTITNDNTYVLYAPSMGEGRERMVEKAVLIKGGSNRTEYSPNGFGGIHTVHGVATTVSSEDLQLLLANPVFQAQMEAGFLTIDDTSNIKDENKLKEKAAKEGEKLKKDKSAQLSASGYRKLGDPSELMTKDTPKHRGAVEE